MKTQSTHGGTRKGAGRKPSPNPLNPILVKVPPHLLAWMRHNRKVNGIAVNQFIVQAIQEKIERAETK